MMGASGLGETLKEGKEITLNRSKDESNIFSFFKRDILPKGEKPAFKLVVVRGPDKEKLRVQEVKTVS